MSYELFVGVRRCVRAPSQLALLTRTAPHRRYDDKNHWLVREAPEILEAVLALLDAPAPTEGAADGAAAAAAAAPSL